MSARDDVSDQFIYEAEAELVSYISDKFRQISDIISF